MRLHRVHLQNIFSFQDAVLTCDHHVTALIGPNDAGKTNILRTLDHLTGQIPTLRFPPEMKCQFGSGEPLVELSFIGADGDREAMGLNISQVPSTPFVLTVRCQNGSLDARLGDQHETLADGDAQETLGGLIQSAFVQAQLRPLRAQTPLRELLSGVGSPEAQFYSLAGLTPADLETIKRTPWHGNLALANAAHKLTGLLRSTWKQDSSLGLHLRTVGDSADDRQIEIRISDTSNADVPLDRRGEGLRWFLALFVQLHQTAQRPALCNVFLIDEPGVYLHPAGQADLCALLSKGLSDSPERQIIYTTHSPFMLDWTRPHEVRVVQRAGDAPAAASIIVDKPYHADRKVLNFWEPFRRSIGLFLGDMGLLGEKNLLVEGATDQIIIAHLARVAREQVNLADWRVIPFGNEYALLLVVKTCKEAGRKVAVLVDGDQAGLGYLNALKNHDCAEIPIHSLSEFYRWSANDASVCIEDFLSPKQYLATVNDAYSELPWYDPIAEAELQDMDRKIPIAKHIERVFSERKWRDENPHDFSKTHVAIHLASSYRPFQLRELDGNFVALAQRLDEPHGPVALATINKSYDTPLGDPWCAVVTLSVKRDVGVQRILVAANGPRDEAVWHFPEGETLAAHRVGEVDESSANVLEEQAVHPVADASLQKDGAVDRQSFSLGRWKGVVVEKVKRLRRAAPSTTTKAETVGPAQPAPPSAAGVVLRALTDEERETRARALADAHSRKEVVAADSLPEADAVSAQEDGSSDDLSEGLFASQNIVVFDCWNRKWVENGSEAFLHDGAGIIRIKGSETLEKATSLAFSILYADSTNESYSIPFSSGRTPADQWKRLMKDKKVGDVVTGVVTTLSSETPAGFWIKIDFYDLKGWVHISEISNRWIYDASEVVSPGKPARAKILRMSPGTLELSIKGVQQPTQ